MVMVSVRSKVTIQQLQQAVASAIGSVRIERLEPSAAAISRLELYAKGEITLEDLRSQTLEQYKTVRTKTRNSLQA